MTEQHYFLALEDFPASEREVTRDEWVRAERRAGFRPRGKDLGQPATGGFCGLGVRGTIRSAPAGRAPWREIDGNLLANALLAVGAAVTPDVPEGLVRELVEYLKEGLDGCDHSVNVCECSLSGVVEELTLWLDHKRLCVECGGDNIEYVGWDNDGNEILATCPHCNRGYQEVP